MNHRSVWSVHLADSAIVAAPHLTAIVSPHHHRPFRDEPAADLGPAAYLAGRRAAASRVPTIAATHGPRRHSNAGLGPAAYLAGRRATASRVPTIAATHGPRRHSDAGLGPAAYLAGRRAAASRVP